MLPDVIGTFKHGEENYGGPAVDPDIYTPETSFQHDEPIVEATPPPTQMANEPVYLQATEDAVTPSSTSTPTSPQEESSLRRTTILFDPNSMERQNNERKVRVINIFNSPNSGNKIPANKHTSDKKVEGHEKNSRRFAPTFKFVPVPLCFMANKSLTYVVNSGDYLQVRFVAPEDGTIQYPGRGWSTLDDDFHDWRTRALMNARDRHPNALAQRRGASESDASHSLPPPSRNKPAKPPPPSLASPRVTAVQASDSDVQTNPLFGASDDLFIY